MVKKRRRHTAAYKFRVALEDNWLEGSMTISQLSSEHEIHANLMRAWKRQLLEGGPSVFASNGGTQAARAGGPRSRIPCTDRASQACVTSFKNIYRRAIEP